VYTEIDVEVLGLGEDAMLVTDGEEQGWVPYDLLDKDESTVGKYSELGETGTIALPEWKANELGLV
jgi:hypothetical protein